MSFHHFQLVNTSVANKINIINTFKPNRTQSFAYVIFLFFYFAAKVKVSLSFARIILYIKLNKVFIFKTLSPTNGRH
jgi:hypothetical protein